MFTLYLFGGGEGNRTPVRKPLDTTFSGCSTSFDLSARCADGQAQRVGNRFMRDRFNGKPPMHVHHCHDVQSRFVVLPRGTGGPQTAALPSLAPRGQRLGSHSNCIVVVYFLSLSSLRDYSALPAYCTSKSPSKPLQTRKRDRTRSCSDIRAVRE